MATFLGRISSRNLLFSYRSLLSRYLERGQVGNRNITVCICADFVQIAVI